MLASALVLGTLTAAVSCTPGWLLHRGQSTSQATTAAEHIPGVLAATVRTSTVSFEPFITKLTVDTNLIVGDDCRLDDPAQLLRWMLATSWSLSDGPPEYFIGLTVRYADGHSVDVDWHHAVSTLPGEWQAWRGDYADDETFRELHVRPADFTPEESRRVVTGPWPLPPPPIPQRAFLTADGQPCGVSGPVRAFGTRAHPRAPRLSDRSG